MKRIISLLAASAAIFTVFSCKTLEPTSLSGDSLPVKVIVTGHARYIAIGKTGSATDPEIVDKGTAVNIFYGIPDESSKVEYALRTVTTDADGFFSAEIGCPAGKTLSVKVNCSVLGDSYALNEDSKYVSTDTWFYGEVKKDIPCGKAGYFKLDLSPAANISEDGLNQPY
ncbi:MAG: hypothetical protein ACI39U_03245 [Candidatus Cryptobacteroides sp.]